MSYLSYDDLARRWGIASQSVRVRRVRGQLPDPDRMFGKSPAWLEATIELYELNEQRADLERQIEDARKRANDETQQLVELDQQLTELRKKIRDLEDNDGPARLSDT